jgi:UDP-2-acetamido-2-deoxy-ribo-hexuluronate aminotransferase
VAIKPVEIRPDRTSVYAQYTLICSDREAVQAKLKRAEIPTAIHYPVPLNEQTAYERFCCPDCTPISSRLARQVLSLAISPDLSIEDQEEIIQALTK